MAPNDGRGVIRSGHAGTSPYHPRTRARCTDMNCTATTGRLVLDGQARPADLAPPPHADPPIYAALVREWRADGRTLPGTRDPQWMLLMALSPAVTGQLAAPPDPGRWERAGVLSGASGANLAPAH